MRRGVFMPVLLALLLAGLCLAGLTGCAEKSGDAQPPDTAQDEPDPAPEPEPTPESEPAGAEPVEPSVPEPAVPAEGLLTEEELKFFNEEFFNSGYINIRNQFLMSSYESPEWIDLLELFYCGTDRGQPITDEERAAFEAAEGCPIETDIVKISAADVDAVLIEHMGISLEETRKIHWDNFRYLPDYGAYYLAHGDTNSWYAVEIVSGTREGGLFHLYYSYNGGYYGDNWMCVTLREAEDSYQFVSNMSCAESDVPNV